MILFLKLKFSLFGSVLFFLLFPTSFCLAIEPIDTTQIDEDSLESLVDTVPKGKTILEYTAHPVLQAVTWPLEKIVVPGVKFVLFPTKAPLRYFLNENVIDRTIRLISIGENNKIMAYPTLNLAPGTSSYTGLTLRHQALFGRPTETLVARGSAFVNGDWKFRSYISATELLGTHFSSKAAFQLTRVKNTSVNQPGTPVFWKFADSSNVYSLALSHMLVEKLGVRNTFTFRDNHYGKAPPQEDTLQSEFFRNEKGVFDPQMRGMESNWQDKTVNVAIFRDSRLNENIPLSGNNFNATYEYHFTTEHHDYQNWSSNWTSYYKLGKEKYEISSEEERKSGSLSMRKVLQKMEYEKLRRELFNRKVLAVHTFVGQSFEVPGNHMPVYGLQTLGNDTPMRGYAGSRFRHYSVASWGAEYRFPIMRLVDGVVFDEYGVYGRSWDKIDFLDNVKNSWGFGIRVRRPDIYLFRAQLGFHGLHGIQLNMSVDEPY